MKHIILFASIFFSPIAIAEQPSKPEEAVTLTLSDARHLLTRTGFGANPAAINRFMNLTRSQAVDEVLAGLTSDVHNALPEWTAKPAPNRWKRLELSNDNRRLFRQIRYKELRSLTKWWIKEMIESPNPQSERLVLFWHNHFPTAYSTINEQTIATYRQHMLLREHGSGNFRTLLKGIIRDPAMLNYLDNNGSRKSNPNENLARELMELFTLGEGNYTEQDVKNAARALTGYSYSQMYDQRFVFKNWNHDTTEKTIFGMNGYFNGDDLVDLILEQPAVGSFIAAKFWQMLIGEIDTESSELTPHAAAFRQSDYDIKTLYRSILASDDFWHIDNRATMIQSPVSLTIGAIRSTGILPSNWKALPLRLAEMGQHLFEPPNVAGWPGGNTWVAPGRLLSRQNWLARFATANINKNQIKTPQPMKDTNLMTSASMTMDSMKIDSTQKSPTPPPKNTLRASGAYLSVVQNPNTKPDAHIAFTLSDVEFNDRYWTTLNFALAKTKEGFAIWIKDKECWPDCLQRWPVDCAEAKEHAQRARTVAWPLKPQRESQLCMYNNLQTPDKELANALWTLIGNVYQLAANSHNMRRNNVAKRYQRWKQHIAKVQETLNTSRYYNEKVKIEIHPRSITDTIAGEQQHPPLPANLSTKQWQEAWERLQHRVPGITLANLLLPQPPVGSFNKNEPSMTEVVTDLVFQLK